MTRKTTINILIFVAALFLIALSFLVQSMQGGETPLPVFIVIAPKPPADALLYSVFRTAPLEVAKVFGRATGCTDASMDLIESTARAAIDADLDPAIAAATVGIESGCNQFAVSSRGAVGLMQIEVKVWRNHFDFADTVNLFNREDSLRVGTKIEAELISQFGTAEGIRRYNGTGTCDVCDPGYTNKILTLAGKR